MAKEGQRITHITVDEVKEFIGDLTPFQEEVVFRVWHECVPVISFLSCPECHEGGDQCSICKRLIHTCTPPEPKGWVIVDEFPDYLINRHGTVKHKETGRLCMFVRLTSGGHALINLSKDGKVYTRSPEAMRNAAFYSKKA